MVMATKYKHMERGICSFQCQKQSQSCSVDSDGRKQSLQSFVVLAESGWPRAFMVLLLRMLSRLLRCMLKLFRLAVHT